MPTEEEFYAVDRIEDGLAVLIGDADEELLLRLTELPKGTREGTVLRVARDAAGKADWSSAQIDEAEARRRKQEAHELLRELRQRDPGGDVTL